MGGSKAARGAARALAIDAELGQLEKEIMHGMLASSSGAAVSADLAEQLRAWDAAVVRLESSAQQVCCPLGHYLS